MKCAIGLKQKCNLKMKKNTGKVFFSILRLLILLSIGYIIIYPMLQMITTAIKSKEAFYNAANVWIPSGTDIKFNFSMAIDAIEYWDGLKSTFLLEIVAGLIEIFSCSVMAYGLSRYKFKLKGIVTICLFMTILIPDTMVIIPRMVNYSKVDFLGILGLIRKVTDVDLRPSIIGSPLAFWLPSLFGIGLRSGILIFIYMQFFKGLPYELEEAAWIDGANPLRTFFSIALPSSGVVITTVLIFSVIWHWNDTFLASMYMKSNYPLAVNLERIITTLHSMGYFVELNVQAQAIMMAACVLFVMPPLIFYMIMQRNFIESIDRVGITG